VTPYRRRPLRRSLAVVLAALGCLLAAAPCASALPPIRHLFIVVLENESADTSFGPASPAHYLASTLPAQGAFITNYYGIGHDSLDNYIAMVSGQGPNPGTQSDGAAYAELTPGTPGPDGQAMGVGAVYPASVQSVANQLQAKGVSWRGYMEDMGNSTTQSKTCRHPAVGSPDPVVTATVGDEYATKHDPFMYFHSIIDDQVNCDAHVVPLDLLAADLRSAATTPNYVFISPNLCHDGHDSPCVDGEPGGLVSADGFLRQWVPAITSSPAFADGALLIVFDEALTSDATACCNERAANSPSPGSNEKNPTGGPGGGRTGAIVLSPYTIPGTRTGRPYNHYSTLRTVEDLFGLDHLGYAAASELTPLGDDVFNGPAPSIGPIVPAGPRRSGCPSPPLARRGRLRRGTLISRVRLVGAGVRRTLTFTLVHRSRVTVVLHPRRGRAHRVRGRDLAGCRSYRVRLSARRGTRIVVSASVGRAAEHRTLRV
jgi:hypothetical protein